MFSGHRCLKPSLWFRPAAPSAVPTVHLMRSTADTLSLSWLPPEKPNGVILDYEIKYHERVRSDFSPIVLTSLPTD